MAEYTIDKIEYGDNVYKLQDNVSGYITGGNVVPYLTCGTGAGTAAKTTTLVTGTLPATLTTGTRVAVKFTNSNTVANPTIAIGSYGAIAIKRYGTTAPSTSAVTSWNAGNVITLVYDGTYWLMADWTTTNTTYSEISETNITSGSGTSTGLVSGRRAKAAVGAFESITDVTVGGTTVVSGRVAAIPAIPTLPSNIVNTITTTAGTHTAITNQTGSVSFNVPTKTSHLTNDSGFITSYTDEKLKWTASTTTNTYYPLVSTSTATTSTANTLNGINFYQYYNTAGGYRRLELGNATANQSTGGAYGAIRLFGANATYYGDLVPGNPELGSGISGAGLSANRTWKIPDKSGTIALTSDLSNYIPKPSNTDDANYGWVLSNGNGWVPSSAYQIAVIPNIDEHGDHDGTYYCWYYEMARDAYLEGRTLELRIDLPSPAPELVTHVLTDYYFKEIPYQDESDYYQIIEFTGIIREIGGSQKKITCRIYLDENEGVHTNGEVTVDVREIGEVITFTGGTGQSNATMSANTWGEIARIQLPAGRWVVTARAKYTPTSGSNHYSAINISTNPGDNTVRDRRYGEGTYYNLHALTRIIGLNDTSYIYLNAGSPTAGTWTRNDTSLQLSAIRIS